MVQKSVNFNPSSALLRNQHPFNHDWVLENLPLHHASLIHTNKLSLKWNYYSVFKQRLSEHYATGTHIGSVWPVGLSTICLGARRNKSDQRRSIRSLSMANESSFFGGRKERRPFSTLTEIWCPPTLAEHSTMHCNAQVVVQGMALMRNLLQNVTTEAYWPI